jgi:protein-disulfide isomerase
MRSVYLPLAAMAATLVACANTKTTSRDSRVALDPSMPVARVNGATVTAGELDKSIDEDLTKATDEYVKQMHDLRKQGLEALVAERLIDTEAKSRGIARDDLAKQEVQGKITPPTDAEIQSYYEKNNLKDRFNVSLEDAKGQISQIIMQERFTARLKTYLDELKAKYKVTTSLPELPITRKQVAATGPSKGPADAKVTIVEFSDFECPFCSRAIGTVNEVMKKYDGKVRLVFRQFPLPMHSHAEKAAEAALCANEQGKFWEAHDKFFASQENLDIAGLQNDAKELGLDTTKFEQCLSSGKMASVVEKDQQDGKKLGVNGTPAFFINGRELSGAQPLEAFSEVIDSELAGGKQ